MFEIENKITTNGLNYFEIIAVNEYQIVVKDLLTGEFNIFSKTQHKFEQANVKIILQNSLTEILNEIEILDKDRKHILEQMSNRIYKWL